MSDARSPDKARVIALSEELRAMVPGYGPAGGMGRFADALEALAAERDALRDQARALKIALAPDMVGGTDYWDAASNPEEIRQKAVRRRDATIDAITSIVKAERDRALAAARRLREALVALHDDEAINERRRVREVEALLEATAWLVAPEPQEPVAPPPAEEGGQ